MSVGEEGCNNDSYITRHLIPLDEAGVEGIEDEHEILQLTVAKVRPIEAKSRVVLHHACA